MYYWRDKSFQVLAEAASYASTFSHWSEYARFCDLLEKGRRKEALNHLAAFVEVAVRWPFPQKKEFVSWLYYFAYEHADSFLLMPYPLCKNFLEPVLGEWIGREPENGEPHRWLATPQSLEEAIRLNSADEIARERLIRMILYWVEYSTHEYPRGYIGNPDEDSQALNKVETLVEGLPVEEKRTAYRARIAKERKLIEDYKFGETGMLKD